MSLLFPEQCSLSTEMKGGADLQAAAPPCHSMPISTSNIRIHTLRLQPRTFNSH